MKPPALSTSRLPPSRQSYRTESQQPSSASSAASDTRSPMGSIPSITSPAHSQSPYRSSSAAASNSPSGTNPSQSPSVSSSPARQREMPKSTVDERLKRLSLDGATTGLVSAPAVRPGPILLRKGGKVRHGSSTQGSTRSSFSDMSDLSISSALEDAYLSNIKGGGGSRMSSFAPGQFGASTRGGSHRQ